VQYLLRPIRWLAGKSPKWNRELVASLEIIGRPGEIDLEDINELSRFSVSRVPLGAGGTRECAFADDERFYGYAWPELCVYRLPKGVLDPRSGLSFIDARVITQSNLGFRDSRDSAFLTGALRRVLKHKPHRMNQPIASLGRTDNFYHFMIESVPRLIAIHSVEPSTLFVTPEEPQAFVQEVGELLGLTFVVAGPDQPLTASSLLVSTPPQLRQPSPAAISLLKSSFDSFRGSDSNSMIYVSRRSATRSFAAELELEEFLALRGFQIVALEGLTVAEQIRVMSGARLVIAPHGAGLTHMIFMEPNSTILELWTRAHWYPSFRNLSCLLNIDFQSINIDDVDMTTLLARIECQIEALA